ncbi:MAG: cell division protein FtsL [Lachnospiraceae bacterium]|nr:cell division protein FtsL [Lachnospiraceae bacterium]
MSDRKRQKADYSKYDKYRINSDAAKDKKNSVTRILFAIIILVLVLAIGSQVYKAHQLKKENAQIESQLKEAKEENEALQQEKKDLTTREYIEKIAREKLGLFYKDEIVLEEE